MAAAPPDDDGISRDQPGSRYRRKPAWSWQEREMVDHLGLASARFESFVRTTSHRGRSQPFIDHPTR
jgi:hypothetical protein